MRDRRSRAELWKAIRRFFFWLLVGMAVIALGGLLLSWALEFRPFPITISEWLATLLASAGGVITGVAFNLLFVLLARLLPRLRASIEALGEKTQILISPLLEGGKVISGTLLETVQVFSASLLDTLGDQTAEALIAISSSTQAVFRSMVELIATAQSVVQQEAETIIGKLKAPKWYHREDAIDPGLIEVSLAITAVLIALPSLVSRDASQVQIAAMKSVRFFSEAIPTLTSISLLDRYAKNRGAKSIHILLNPIEDGPFFLLGWAIVIAFVIIAVITFRVS